MTRRFALTAAAGLALIATACMPKPPPPAIPPQIASPCDPNHTPGNGRSWCMKWVRLKDGVTVTGPVWEFQFDKAHGGAKVIVNAIDWRSAP
jgi:hypothetical protein